MRKLPQNLAFRLGLVILLALAPAALVAVAQNMELRGHLLGDATQRVRHLSEALAGQGRETLAGTRQFVAGISRLPQLQARDAASLGELLRGVIRQSPGYRACTLYDPSGALVASSREEGCLANVSGQSWFQAVQRSQSCSEAENITASQSKLPLMVMGCAVRGEQGNLAGVLCLTFDYGWFERLTGGLGLPSGALAEVIDSSGAIHARYPVPLNDDARQVPLAGAAARLDRVLGGEGIHKEAGHDGVLRIYSYSPLTRQQGRELFVRVGIPVTTALFPAQESARRSIIGLGLAGLVGLLGAAFFARKSIIAPAREILEATRRLGQGELSHRIQSTGSDELAQLAHGVDAMASSLESSTQALRQAEQKVRNILENSLEGYFVTTVAGRFMEGNAAHLRMFGYDTLDALEAEVTDIGRQVYVNPAATRTVEVDRVDIGLALNDNPAGEALSDGRGDEKDICESIRTLVSYLPLSCEDLAPEVFCEDDLNRSMVQLENTEYDLLKLIDQIADERSVFEVSKDSSSDPVTCFNRMNGKTVGVIANNAEGYLTSFACDKMAGFADFCDAFNLPIVTLTNAKGFATDNKEEAMLPKAAAYLLSVFASATVPKINVIVGEALGNAYTIMNSKGLGADFVFAWENAKVQVMPEEEAAQILYPEEIAKATDKKAFLNQKAEEYRSQAGSAAFLSRGYIEKVIAPADTRKYIVGALEILSDKRAE